jgi:glycosyltransferase involved in cell wall biosynthesis
MRIALSALQQRDYLTGTGRYISELFRHLPEQAPGHEFLLYLKPSQRKLYPLGGERARHRIIETCPEDPSRRALWELLRLTSLLRADQLDLYHGPANFLPPRKVCPYVLTLHDMFYFRNPRRTGFARSLYWRGYLRATWRLADRILTDSEHSKREILHFLPVPEERIRVIPMGVDGRFFEDAPAKARRLVREHYGLHRPYVLFIARLDPDKNHEGVLRSFARVCEKGNRDLELVIGGARDYQSARLPVLARELGLEQRVRFLGYVEEQHLVALYQEAAVFCYPSFNEGFGLPPLEAMAAGVPVVSSGTSSLPEVVGEAGILVNPRSTESIAAGIVQCLAPSRARELREAGRERARLFTWENTARLTHDVYKEILRS